MRRAWLLMFALAGCGPLAGESPFARTIDRVIGAGAVEEPAAPPPDLREVLTREMIEGLPNDLLLVDVASRGATATLVPAGENGARRTWVSPDGISVTEEGGLIVATRGFGFDLMAAEVSGLRDLLAGAESARYVTETLDGRDQVVRQAFDCTASERAPDPITIFERRYATVRVQVICANGALRFGNSYWVDDVGTIWRSQQLVTPELGYLTLETL